MTPQAYPLECWADDGTRVVVIGWTDDTDVTDNPNRRLHPVVVPLAGRGYPQVLTGPIGYSLVDGPPES